MCPLNPHRCRQRLWLTGVFKPFKIKLKIKWRMWRFNVNSVFPSLFLYTCVVVLTLITHTHTGTLSCVFLYFSSFCESLDCEFVWRLRLPEESQRLHSESILDLQLCVCVCVVLFTQWKAAELELHWSPLVTEGRFIKSSPKTPNFISEDSICTTQDSLWDFPECTSHFTADRFRAELSQLLTFHFKCFCVFRFQPCCFFSVWKSIKDRALTTLQNLGVYETFSKLRDDSSLQSSPEAADLTNNKYFIVTKT